MIRALIPLASALLILAAPPALASAILADAEGPRDTVEAFMSAFDAKDAEAMTALIDEDAIVFVIEEREGEDRAQSLALSDLVSSIANAPAEIAEPVRITNVQMDGPVAMVWTEFGFYMDGTLSHCGVNIFTLTRVEGKWRIATITYSHIEQPCEDAPTP